MHDNHNQAKDSAKVCPYEALSQVKTEQSGKKFISENYLTC